MSHRKAHPLEPEHTEKCAFYETGGDISIPCDCGADRSDRQSLKESFMGQTAKNLPEGWNFGSDGETTMGME